MISEAIVALVAIAAVAWAFERVNSRAIAHMEKINIRLVNHNRQLAIIAKARDASEAQGAVACDRMQTLDLAREETAPPPKPEEPFAPPKKTIIRATAAENTMGGQFQLVGDPEDLPEGLKDVELPDGRASAG